MFARECFGSRCLAALYCFQNGVNFQNIFNRTEMQNPAATSFTAPTTKNATNGFLTGGFGFINYVSGSTFQPPRQGTLEMRLQF